MQWDGGGQWDGDGDGDGQWDSCERTALGEENQRNHWRRPSLIVLGTTTTPCR